MQDLFMPGGCAPAHVGGGHTVRTSRGAGGTGVLAGLVLGLSASAQHDLVPRGLDLSDPAIADGLAALRAPDALSGAACVNCHAPDGFDLAYIGFSDDDIRRRAAPHVSDEMAEAIVGLVHRLREHYEITEPKDPETFRPFQPGGSPLPAGPSRSEQDGVFAAWLVASGYPLVRPGEYVDHPEAALELMDELHALDPRVIPIGLPLNRWSEDFHDGSGLIADWMSEQGRIPGDAASREQLYALHDAYLAEPSWDHFFGYYERIRELTDLPAGPGSAKLSTEKHLSVQIAQHLFRQEVSGGGGLLDQPRMAFDTPGSPFWQDDRHSMVRLPNPMWEVGDGVRVYDRRDEFEYDGLALLSIDPAIAWSEQIEATRIPWFFVGWLFNPTLQRISGSNSTKSGEYFSDRGLRDHDGDLLTHVSYYMHLYKVNQIMEPRAADRDADIGQPRNWRPTLSNFTRHTAGRFESGRRFGVDAPSSRAEFMDDAHERTFVRLTINGGRMLLYRYRDELRERGPFGMDADDRGLGWMEDLMTELEPGGDHPRLFDEIVHLLEGHAYDRTDLDLDGRRSVLDLLVFFEDFTAGDERADLDRDRAHTVVDILSFVDLFAGG